MHLRDGTRVRVLRHRDDQWVNFEGYAYWTAARQGGGWSRSSGDFEEDMVRIYVVLPEPTNNPDRTAQPHVPESDLETI